jgi:hypothetical protein
MGNQKIKWKDSYTISYAYTLLAKKIEGTRILGKTWHDDPLSYCEACDSMRAYLIEQQDVEYDDWENAKTTFSNYFRPIKHQDAFDNSAYWWGNPYNNTEQQHNARILAILLFQYMIEQNDVENW